MTDTHSNGNGSKYISWTWLGPIVLVAFVTLAWAYTRTLIAAERDTNVSQAASISLLQAQRQKDSLNIFRICEKLKVEGCQP